MILVVESGSTKADWVITDGRERTEFVTKGLNPLFISSEEITEKIKSIQVLMDVKESISNIHFYGAGCSDENLKSNVELGFRSVFAKAEIGIESDLMAAAKATFCGEPGVVCILGTGANSAFFDGDSLQQEIPSLGYILGDEGSGAYLGKQLVKDYFYAKLPAEIAAQMHTLLKSKSNVLEKVYRSEAPNRFLASLAIILSKFPSHPYTVKLLTNSFNTFLDSHVGLYMNKKKYPIHFVGSIAYNFKNILEDLLVQREWSMGEVLQRPLERLVQHHLE